MATKQKKTLTLYFINDGTQNVVTDKLPILDNGQATVADDSMSMDICDDGLQVLGVPLPDEGDIIRLILTVEAVEFAKYEATFKSKK